MTSFDLNTLTLYGVVAHAPACRPTTDGRSRAVLSVAIVRDWQVVVEGVSEPRQDTDVVEVVCWGPLADRVSTVRVGDRVIVIGRLQQKVWETEVGRKASRLRVVAQDVGVIRPPSRRHRTPRAYARSIPAAAPGLGETRPRARFEFDEEVV